MMGKVIGPVGDTKQNRFTVWRTMRELRDDIKTYAGIPKYKKATEKHKETYKDFLAEYAKPANDNGDMSAAA